MENTKTHSKVTRELFFWSGIIATVAYRIIVVLNNYSSTWVSIAWYIGTIGFIIYFIHRYDISNKRANLIVDNKLAYKVKNNKALTDKDREALIYILQTLKTTKEKWNYIVIFATSGLALIVGIYLDFFR